MALVGPSPEKRRRLGFGPQFAKSTDPTAHGDNPSHPTLAEVAQRKREIELWEALNVGGYRFAKTGTITGAVISFVLVVLAVTPIPPNWPWDIPTMILAVFTAVATVTCGLLWFDNPRAASRPAALKIVPFSRAENLQLMTDQTLEPYSAVCTCPGCGDTSTHLIREPATGEPGWAMVTRRCAVCEREWAQA
jgi:hypothetical protein